MDVFGIPAAVGRPDRITKEKYFDDYLHNPARPEDGITESLGAFNYGSQSTLTEPYLKPALEALPQIKQERKIFFLVEWVSAFVEGQQTASAQAEVAEFLRTAAKTSTSNLKPQPQISNLK